MELKDKIRRIIAKKKTYYHGTSSKFVRKILKEGFIPNPKERIWDGVSNDIVSYEGTYFTPKISQALQFAWQSTMKVGGHEILVTAQIETKTSYPDIHTLPQMQKIISNHIREEDKMTEGTSEYVEGILKNKMKLERLKDKWQNQWFKEYKKKEKLPKLSTDAYEKKIKKYIEKWIENILKDIKENDYIASHTTESKKREEVEMITKNLSSEVQNLPGSNIRVTTPITFSGANKIKSIIKVKQNTKTGAYELEALYGSIAADERKEIMEEIRKFS